MPLVAVTAALVVAALNIVLLPPPASVIGELALISAEA